MSRRILKIFLAGIGVGKTSPHVLLMVDETLIFHLKQYQLDHYTLCNLSVNTGFVSGFYLKLESFVISFSLWMI